MRNVLQSFLGKTPGFAYNLHTVSKGGTVKIKTGTSPKLEDHGVHCLFVGYSLTILPDATGCATQKCTGCV